jgi:glycosyltransferase involved in cell wall biosynthesis
MPVFNESENLAELYKRSTDVMSSFGEPYELIFVDDGSRDDSVMQILRFREQDKSVKLVRLSRNFGHQLALSAGLAMSSGQAVIAMDSDLQDSPEVISKFVELWRQGNEVVYAIRQTRQEGFHKQFAYRLFYRIMDWYSDIKIPRDAGDFSLMDRKVVDLLNKLPERARYIRGLRAWVGFKQIGVPVDRSARFAGQPKYSLKMLVNLAMSGLFSFSMAPLRFASSLGIVVSFLSFVGILVVFYFKFFTNLSLPGFAAVATILFFLGGIQLLTVGILGEYVGRILDEVRARPLFIIEENVGFESEKSD